MNAITAIRPDESIRGTAIERAHAKAISELCPGCDEMEMAVRVELAMLRDAATVGMARASGAAAPILDQVVRLATYTVHADVPTSRLLRVRSALTFTIEAARAVERALRDG